jgi:hypothetical protein
MYGASYKSVVQPVGCTTDLYDPGNVLMNRTNELIICFPDSQVVVEYGCHLFFFVRNEFDNRALEVGLSS